MVEEAKAKVSHAIVELEAAVPPDVRNLPIEELTAPQALGRASLSGLYQLIRIIEQPIDPENLKHMRIIGDMALGANRLLQKHGTDARKLNLIDKLIDAMEAEKAPQIDATEK